ncbi:ribonuclease MRP protein subunit Snm1p [[Candida] anglica]
MTSIEKARTPAQATALELLDLAHSIPLNPLNKVYFTKFTNHCAEKAINLPDGYTLSKICLKCGVLYIPGITVSMRITYGKTSSRKRGSKKSKSPTKNVAKDTTKSRPRRLEYKCLQCQSVQVVCQDLLAPKPAPVVTKDPVYEATWPPSSSISKSKSSSPAPVSTQGGTHSSSGSRSGSATPPPSSQMAKKRSKKRKDHNLLSMINKKKEESSKVSLNLMDFMK